MSRLGMWVCVRALVLHNTTPSRGPPAWLSAVALPAILSGLTGCGAGVVVGALAGASGGGGGGGGSGAVSFEVTNPSPALSSRLSNSCKGIPVETAADLSPFANGQVPILFTLSRTDKPRDSGTAQLRATVRRGTEKLLTEDFSRSTGPDGEYILDTKSLPLGVLERITVEIGPADGTGKPGLTEEFTVDNRLESPPGTSCLCSGPCASSLTGEVRWVWSIEKGTTFAPDLDRAAVYVTKDGVLELVPSRTEQDSAGACCGQGIVTTWDSKAGFDGRSEEVVPVLVVPDVSEKFRPVVLTDEADTCLRLIDNTPPEVSTIRVFSEPEGVRQRLVGRVVIQYTVRDEGEEKADLALKIKLIRGNELTLNAKDENLRITEALAPPSEGARNLPTTREAAGLLHTFVWNADADIERLVRSKKLEPTDLDGLTATFEITLKDTAPCLESKQLPPVEKVIDTSLAHSIAGLVAGRTEPGKQTVSPDGITFVELFSAATDPSQSILYLTDSDTQTLWKVDFPKLGDFTRIAGGRNQVRPGSVDPKASELGEALLDSPGDLEVSASGNEIFLLERSGVVSRIDLETKRIAPLLTKDVLNGPQALALDESDAKNRSVYVADTSNCRVIRVNADAPDPDDPGEAKVIFGSEKRLRLQGVLDGYPLSNGCNGGRDPLESDLCRAEFSDSPAGLALFRNSKGQRFLFVSQPLQNRVLTIDADTGAQVGSLGPFSQAQKDCPDPTLLSRPRLLRRIDNDLYIASDGVRTGVDARGIIIRSRITEGGDDIPRLGDPVFVAGTVKSLRPDLECGCTVSALSNYNPRQECAPADEVPLANPSAVVQDKAGDLYVCDVNNQRIRKLVACNGETDKRRLSTFLGGSVQGREEKESYLGIDEIIANGAPRDCVASPLLQGFTKDETPLQENATLAKLSKPTGIAFLDASNLLIADTGNDRVRRLDLRTGLITTLAGAVPDARQLAQCIAFAGDGGPATEAILNEPRAIAVFPPYRPGVQDASRFVCEPRRAIYVLDQLNGLVRKIDADGEISTFAGSGFQGLERGNCSLEPLPPGTDERANADLATSPANPTRVYIKRPRGLMADTRGRVFIAECRQRILVVNPEGTALRRIIGKGQEISLDDSDPEFYDDCEEEPRQALTSIAIGDGGDPLDATLFNPGEMVFDEDEENLYFADLGNNRIRRVGPYDRDSGTFGSGATIQTVAGNGGENEEVFEGAVSPNRAFHQPYGLDIDHKRNLLYFCTEFGSRIYRLDLRSDMVELIAGGERNSSVGDGDAASNVRLRSPTSLRLDAFGNVFTADSGNHRIRRFLPGN